MGRGILMVMSTRWLLAAGFSLLSDRAHAGPMLMGLDDLPGGTFASAGQDVSGDGSTVVGSSSSEASAAFEPIPSHEAFRWTTRLVA